MGFQRNVQGNGVELKAEYTSYLKVQGSKYTIIYLLLSHINEFGQKNIQEMGQRTVFHTWTVMASFSMATEKAGRLQASEVSSYKVAL